MANQKLAARIEQESPDCFLVRAPAVGVVDRIPRQGKYLNPMEVFLTLKVLGQRLPVLLPRRVQGRVTELLTEGTTVPVSYDQPLFRLRLGLESEEQGAAAGKKRGEGAAAEDDLIPVPAPSEGIFYRKPSPDAPPYAEVGATVKRGSVLGLVEVMKSFNQIVYGGPGLPEQGTVAAIKVEDSAEVAFGQTLFLIKPE